jgi:hypothetical protein
MCAARGKILVSGAPDLMSAVTFRIDRSSDLQAGPELQLRTSTAVQ